MRCFCTDIIAGRQDYLHSSAVTVDFELEKSLGIQTIDAKKSKLKSQDSDVPLLSTMKI